jgi:formylglycine-generating enzyme required for sulfatase activity
LNQRESGSDSRTNSADIIEPIKFRPASSAPPLPRFKLPWAQAFIALIVAIGAWGAWYVITARSVNIATEPADATVTVDELIAPVIRDRWVLRPGLRRFVVEAEGYKRFADEILITDEPIQTHNVTLDPLPGKLRVEVAPVAAANVTIDDTITAQAPTTIGNIEAGPREVKVAAERYIPFETIVEIEGRGIEQTLSVVLQPAWADVSIASQPAGAAVNIDDESHGSTPFTGELIQGQREVRLTLDGYKPWQRTLKVVAGETLNLPPVILAKADGYLKVATVPAGAAITIDKLYKGQSPIRTAVTPDEQHQISILKEGYAAAARTVSAASGETKSLTVELEPELAQVEVISTPEGAELFIDGVARGSANQTLKLPTHKHLLEIRKPGFVSYSAQVTPRKGIRKRIKVRLKKPTDASATSTPAAQKTAVPGAVKDTITTAAGQTLKLFRGGRITMGSSRREPGRRANEVLREANLARPFYFGLKEVSNGEFRQFLATHRVSPSNGIDVNGDQHPVVNISWDRAAIFCNWLSRKDSLPVFYQIKNGKVLGVNPQAIGYRLPTEAEWAWVARTAPKGDEPFKFPWAGKYPPRGRSGNYADQSASGFLQNVVPDYTDGFPVTAPVGSFMASLRGVYDMGGNVSEWVHDYYVAAPAQNTVEQDPLGPRQGETHVVRGSNWGHASETELRLAYRDFGKDGRDDIGFRIARYAQ